MITALMQVHKLHNILQINVNLLRFFKTSMENASSNTFHAQNTTDDIMLMLCVNRQQRLQFYIIFVVIRKLQTNLQPCTASNKALNIDCFLLQSLNVILFLLFHNLPDNNASSFHTHFSIITLLLKFKLKFQPQYCCIKHILFALVCPLFHHIFSVNFVLFCTFSVLFFFSSSYLFSSSYSSLYFLFFSTCNRKSHIARPHRR